MNVLPRLLVDTTLEFDGAAPGALSLEGALDIAVRGGIAEPSAEVLAVAQEIEAFAPRIWASEWGLPPVPPSQLAEELDELPADIEHWVTYVPERAPYNEWATSGPSGFLFPDDRTPRPALMLFVSGGEPSIRRLLIPLVEDGGFGRPEVLLTGGDCGEPLGSGCERNTCGECVNSLYVFEGFAVRYCSCPHG